MNLYKSFNLHTHSESPLSIPKFKIQNNNKNGLLNLIYAL